MENFFTDSQRCLQAEFGTTALADRIHEAAVAPEISDQQADFIHARNCFFCRRSMNLASLPALIKAARKALPESSTPEPWSFQTMMAMACICR